MNAKRQQLQKYGESIEMHQLRYFREVARCQNVSKAAATLHVSQSALSRSIRKLETELKVQLFDRKGKRLSLNENGIRLLDDVERVLDDFDQSIQSFGDNS